MQRLQNLLLLAVSTMSALLLAEIIVANLRPQWTERRLLKNSAGNKRPSDILPFRMCNSCQGRLVRSEFSTRITINSLGLRGKEVDLDRPTGHRILVVGDSFTYGWGVEDDETYPVVLERRLAERLGENSVQVLNAGFAAGYYPDTYYLWLKEFGMRFEPDLIIVGFYVGNDIDHDKAFENVWAEVDEDGLPTRITTPKVEIVEGHRVRLVRRLRYRYPVLRNSHLFQAIATAFDRVSNESSPAGIEQRPTESAQAFQDRERSGAKSPNQPQAPSFNRWMYRAEYVPRTIRIVDKIERLLLAMADLARAEEVPFIIVMIPAREQLLPSEYGFERHPFMADHDLDKPQRLFSVFFGEQHIPYLDLLPLLRSETSAPPLYYPHDHHFTPRGNDVAARHLERFLLETGVVALTPKASE